jgi:hypothetical protein
MSREIISKWEEEKWSEKIRSEGITLQYVWNIEILEHYINHSFTRFSTSLLFEKGNS